MRGGQLVVQKKKNLIWVDNREEEHMNKGVMGETGRVKK